jgi:hypothetical protein
MGFHDWTARRNDAGERYDVCARCDTSDAWMPTGMGWRMRDM